MESTATGTGRRTLLLSRVSLISRPTSLRVSPKSLRLVWTLAEAGCAQTMATCGLDSEHGQGPWGLSVDRRNKGRKQSGKQRETDRSDCVMGRMIS